MQNFRSDYIYLFYLLVLYIYFSKPNIPVVKDLNLSNSFYTKLTEVLLRKGFGDLYHFNLQGLFNDNPNFILRFSNSDLKSKDSIYNLIKTNEIKLTVIGPPNNKLNLIQKKLISLSCQGFLIF